MTKSDKKKGDNNKRDQKMQKKATEKSVRKHDKSEEQQHEIL